MTRLRKERQSTNKCRKQKFALAFAGCSTDNETEAAVGHNGMNGHLSSSLLKGTDA